MLIMENLKTISSDRAENLTAFDALISALNHLLNIFFDKSTSLNCQYAQPMHIIGKVSPADFDFGSGYSNCSTSCSSDLSG